jgi:uncharacterized protein (DUF1697 family)
MAVQIALLRAINVGGRSKVAMSDLRDVFGKMGFADIQTILQTGNIIFRSEKLSGEKLSARIEQQLVSDLGLQTDMLVRSAEEWVKIVAANPFPDIARDKPNFLVLMPLKTRPAAEVVESLRSAIKGPEMIETDGSQLYISYPAGIGRSKLTNSLIEARLQTRGTGRNWNTVLKIASAASR